MQYYDMGKAFQEKSFNGNTRCFQNKTDLDVLQNYEKYPDKVKNISEKIETSLNKKFIKNILEDGAFKDFDEGNT